MEHPGLSHTSPNDLLDFESAPSSADSSLAHQKPILFRKGVVDPSALLGYLDRCHCQDLGRSSHELEYHHIYFPKDKFRSVKPPLVVRQLRNLKYNLVEMLSCQEDHYHKDTAEEVPQDKIDLEAAGTYLEEGSWLTDYAALSWLAAYTQNRLDNPSTLTRANRARLSARVVLLNELQAESAERIDRIEVMSDVVVHGALIKYLAQQPQQRMQTLVENRMDEGSAVLPTQIYGPAGLKDKAEKRLFKYSSSRSWLVRKLVSIPETEAA